ncbi:MULTISPECIES: nucleoid-associated protein [Sphingobacterium]|uniref:Nucleoid associated protein NdpA n=2 Tax=Sphingobacterium TaxID=28453 RepID=A0A4R6WK97_9SPHI|nr:MULTISPECIES: nucleoid-associated protein [Sphingobacterium]MBL1407388.1 nucleoid-associated protein [Sphingobacterium faecale]TDQ78160.1 nucleoid associated protein NdpA [Sphingobacterium yanglingense]
MFFYQDASFENLSIHHVGNKANDEFYILSEAPVDLVGDEVLPDLLMQYFMKPFVKANEVYRFFHPNEELQLNEVYHFSKKFFDREIDFHEFSQQVTKHLYEVSEHPKIKPGEVYVVSLKNVQMEGEDWNAVGIFKSENKEAYLKVYPEQGGFQLNYEQEAININKLDKGVVIVNTEAEEGFKVLVVDQTNQSEAVYWKDNFLQLKSRNDNYQQTGNLMKVYKNFVNEKLDEVFELETADKIDLLNRSMNYFKTKETFDSAEFEEEVIGNPQAAGLFNEYKQNFEDEFDLPFQANFEIATPAVKKMQSSYKSVIKLDKNFHVYVHGKREYLEHGYDEEKGMNYYKLYYENESEG